MSYTTIDKATKDAELQDRVRAAACKEAWNNAEFALTEYGERLRTYPNEAVGTFIWPVSIEYEAPYEFAVNGGNEHPGGDPAVITDANIQSSVQAHWPRDTIVPLPSDMVGPTPGDLV